MEALRERISFLRGLAQGLDLDGSTQEGRLLQEMIGVLGDLAENVTRLQAAQNQLEHLVESMDDDLVRLEDDVYEMLPVDDVIELTCGHCGETVAFDTDIFFEDEVIEVTCPNCDEVVFIPDTEKLEMIRKDKDVEEGSEPSITSLCH
ncbi:MAG: AraC family transcriptional regulator [Heliobacteriaceae bacterium]|nr:AraC family transcriptional regulator [Heliobacteriaceae bacterium]MDD4587199.1 AraC family transcriptional regulator [Heliobacteriaceae bacterium]